MNEWNIVHAHEYEGRDAAIKYFLLWVPWELFISSHLKLSRIF